MGSASQDYYLQYVRATEPQLPEIIQWGLHKNTTSILYWPAWLRLHLELRIFFQLSKPRCSHAWKINSQFQSWPWINCRRNWEVDKWNGNAYFWAYWDFPAAILKQFGILSIISPANPLDLHRTLSFFAKIEGILSLPERNSWKVRLPNWGNDACFRTRRDRCRQSVSNQ